MIELDKEFVPDWGAKNVLGLPDPKEILCAVRYYRNSHALMRIRLDHSNPDDPPPAPQLIFLQPTYFEGPLNWQGAGINVGEKQELIDLLGTFGGKIPPSHRSDMGDMRLYLIPTSTPYVIRIIAFGFILSATHITIGMIYP